LIMGYISGNQIDCDASQTFDFVHGPVRRVPNRDFPKCA